MKEWPEKGELVIGVVTNVYNYGAFVKLEEYGGKEGLIHISEVASGWIKNIRDYVREGQRIVAKVLQVNPAKGHIDLSLKAVTPQQKRMKIESWKRLQKAIALLKLAANQLKKDEKEIEEIKKIIVKKYPDVYSLFEECVISGKEVLKILPKEWREVLYKLSLKTVEIPKVTIKGNLYLQTPAKNGIDIIKNALKILEEDNKLEVTYAGAPKYFIKVTDYDYKSAEKFLEKKISKVMEYMKDKGTVKFERL